MENKETKTGLTKEQERCLMNDSPLNGRKETTDKIPTAELKEILFKHIHPDPTDRMLKFYNLVDYSGVYKAMKEYALLHLTKQAEVIAEKAKTKKGDFLTGANAIFNPTIVDKQSILQASEEYKQSVK